MIKSKLSLYLSFVSLITSMILNFPFPHKYPYGEVIFTRLSIPIRFANGFHTVGIISLLLLIIGLYFLVKSLKKYHGRIVVLTIVIVIVAPATIVSSFQNTFATGIYAISYSNEESNCRFEMIREGTLHGECELPFKNLGKKDVQFTVQFYEERFFNDELPMVSLMNSDAPYNVALKAKEKKHVHIETEIDVSNIENHIESGEAMGVNVLITSKGKSRSL